MMMRAERLRQALTQRDLALLSETNQARISQMERGLLVPSAGERERIAAVLEVPAAELLEDVAE